MNKNPYSKVFIDNDLAHSKALKLYKKRCRDFMSTLDAPCVFISPTHGPAAQDRWITLEPPIYQDPNILYLTGINQHHTAILFNPHDVEHRITLFLPEKDEKTEFWEGKRFGTGSEKDIQDAQELTGIQHILPITDLKKTLETVCKTEKKIYSFWHTAKKNHPLENDGYTENYKKLRRWLKPPHTIIENIAPTLWQQRLQLDSTDRDNIATAINITHAAFIATLKHIPKLQTEQQAAAFLNGHIHTKTPHGNSFPTIVASGQNATTLHYTKNDDPFDADDLILFDFGCRYHEMHSDISRTIPKSGKFNPLQAGLYTCVLNAQKRVQAAVKPGVTFDELNKICWPQLFNDVQEFISKNRGSYSLPYKDRPHNIGHYLGREVHDGDPNRNYKNQPLKAGECITNEPGLYGYFKATFDSIEYAGHIGIRIEDDLLITKTGCENLSIAIPKEIADIEALYP